ncbi:hypothetical protein BDQ17DRAFT_1547867, partial [Cyathus striatus]
MHVHVGGGGSAVSCPLNSLRLSQLACILLLSPVSPFRNSGYSTILTINHKPTCYPPTTPRTPTSTSSVTIVLFTQRMDPFRRKRLRRLRRLRLNLLFPLTPPLPAPEPPIPLKPIRSKAHITPSAAPPRPNPLQPSH